MEQGNVAKKLTGKILENWLLTLADGHGGIQTITKTGTSGLVDTYTIAFADETTSTFTVTNGRSISGLTTSKSGKVTTITITYNDNTTSSFTVRDGENVSSITEYWAVSTSGSQQPQSGWQTTPPTLTATYKYLWHYSKYTLSDGTNTSTTPAVQGVYGDKGDTGNTGTSITSVTKTGTSGLVDTYTITFSNGTTTTFNVTNGSEIESIEKTSTAGLVDTYTVTMGSGDTHTFTVTNGRSIVSFTQTSGTHAAGTIDVYTMTYNDGDTSQIQVYNGANGTGAVSTVAGIGVSSADGDVPLIIRGYGAPTTATIGQVNQLYFDMTGGIMYICIASAGGSYDWRGMSSAVDSAMSTTSANPLQNRVISNKVGVGSLSSAFSATNLTDAANELQTNKANLASPTFTGTPKAPTAAAGTNNTQLATTAFVQNIASDLNGAIKTIKPTLNILVIGNSFDQDMFAYLPPVLNEMLPEYEINYCVLHQDSADFDLINTMYVNDTKFQYTNKWLLGANAWERIPSSGNSWTLKQAIQAYRWDMVFMQATTADVASDTTIQNKIITPGRKLTRAIIANAIAPLNFYTIEWLARGASDSVIESTYTDIHNGIIKTMQNMGFDDYVPLGTAFQNARTNSTLKALGDGISMLYSDNIHVQAGAPALLGTYTLAAFIARKCGKPNGVYASAFQPTTENAEAINAKPSGSAVGMTHGNSTTITTVIKRALQEIVYITMNNPTVVTDCSSVTATPPT